jgi:hypothetical protein
MADKQNFNCKGAVKRAYLGMRQNHGSEHAAFETATGLLRFHHPELTIAEAIQQTADILEQ